MDNFSLKICVVVSMIFITACQNGSDTAVSGTKSTETKIFQKLSVARTGLDFENTIRESDDFNYLLFDGMYQGAGVGVGDFNNDGLQDLFFTGNMVADRIYINKGGFRFEDISKTAGISGGKGWSTGVAIADINGDGFDDIYVSKFLLTTDSYRKNLLFVNNGDLTFSEKSEDYGIDDSGYSIMSNFFDYDLDGDLDLYVCNQPANSTALKAQNKGKIDYRYTDRLYRNMGDVRFEDVTEAAGIKNYTYSLSATSGDFNNDGWPDLYVACDYEEPDILLQNNGNGTFTNIANEAIAHMSNFSMGSDVADINNDGWLDIYTADMVAADNSRLKTNMSGMNPEKFWKLVETGYHHQYMFNSLQLNNGNGSFSEIAQLSGVSNTDWSWSPLFVDFDNDGWKDLVVTNGLLRDVRDNDFNIRRKAYMQEKLREAERQGVKELFLSGVEILKMAPSIKLSNFVYRNNGDLTFETMMSQWGMDHKGWTHGAAYADFDNDGDIDVVMNAMNEKAFIYQNQTEDQRLSNYLRFELKGGKFNPTAIGARVTIWTENGMQIMEQSQMRGYMSTSEPIIHFGLGALSTVNKAEIKWPDGRLTTLNDLAANQVVTLNQKKASASSEKEVIKTLFVRYEKSNLDFEHSENLFDDYEREILLPYKLSALGPALAKSDINGDGLDDLYIGGAIGQSGILYVQQPDGSFTQSTGQPWASHSASEDICASFFDADGDGDMDLYVGSGGNEYLDGDVHLKDRVYIQNDGQFSLNAKALPDFRTSSGTVAPGDVDGDGDMDLFVGTRQIAGKYGYIPESYLLINNGGIFSIDPQAEPTGKIGMVTDALWTDFDGDQDNDLIVVGEWMAITIFENQKGQLSNISVNQNLDQSHGWWNRIAPGDLDGDGDMDYVVGNLGLNIKYKASKEQPFKVFVKDFDMNGTNDVYLGYYDTDGVCYPVRGRTCSSQQMPFIKKKFTSYESFGNASIEQVLGDKIEGAVYHEAKVFESVWLENISGKLVMHNLPLESQFSTVNSIVVDDFNYDGHQDIFVAGNFFEREVETTRSDASVGCILAGNGSGGFSPLHASQTGILSKLNARNAVQLNGPNGSNLLVVTNNNGPLDVYALNPR